MSGILHATVGFVVGVQLWWLVEYLLHRFAMHQMRGRGIMSREHLEHHVHASWRFDPVLLQAWAGVLLVGFVGWGVLGWWLWGAPAGLGLAAGWTVAYGFYEYQHAQAHRRAPTGRYTHFVRKHHFHHHFGHPMANHGVSVDWWDRVFRTKQAPQRVRVPRRLAMAWLLDDHGELRPELAEDYELVGSLDGASRLAALDRVRAFASVAPAD